MEVMIYRVLLVVAALVIGTLVATILVYRERLRRKSAYVDQLSATVFAGLVEEELRRLKPAVRVPLLDLDEVRAIMPPSLLLTHRAEEQERELAAAVEEVLREGFETMTQPNGLPTAEFAQRVINSAREIAAAADTRTPEEKLRRFFEGEWPCGNRAEATAAT